MGGIRGAQSFWRRNMRERDHLEHQGIDGRIILKLIVRKLDGRGVDVLD
jgi:hypothetical protein